MSGWNLMGKKLIVSVLEILLEFCLPLCYLAYTEKLKQRGF